MIDDSRLQEILAAPGSAREDEIAALCTELAAWRPVHGLVYETLQAIHLNAKECAQRSLELDVITAASRSAMKRMKGAGFRP